MGTNKFIRCSIIVISSIILFLPGCKSDDDDPGVTPASPSGLEVENITSTTVNLKWMDNADNENGFRLERRQDTSSDFEEIQELPSGTNTYLDTDLEPETVYQYRILAYNVVGSSGYSNTQEIKTLSLISELDAPQLSGQVVSSTQINLSWNDNTTNEEGFRIERAEVNSGTYTEIAEMGPNVTTYTDIDLTANTEYHYRIRAYKADQNSDYSNVVSLTTPPIDTIAPSNLQAKVISSSQIDLTWKDNSDNETGFKIERVVGTSTTFTEVATVAAGVTKYSNIGLTSNTQYTYRVRAYSDGGNSDYSNTVLAVTNTSLPNAPSGLVATTVSSSQINLFWKDNSNNETGFKIERATNGGSYQQITTVAAEITSYSSRNLSFGTQYSYRVRAYNAAGNSNYSNVASSTTQPPAEIRVYATEDNELITNSADPTWAGRVFSGGLLELGCNFSILPFNSEFVCASSAIKFGSLQNQINGRNIKKATLRLYISYLPADRGTTYAVNAFAGSWSTNSITFNNQPNYYISPQINIEPPSTDAIPYDINVTAIVQNWARGSLPNYGFLLRDLASSFPTLSLLRATGFESLENNSGSARRPQVIVEFQ